MAQPLLVLSLVVLFLGLKIGVLYGLSMAFDIPKRQRIFFAFLLAQGGEFGFVVFGAAATAHIFTPQTGSLLVVVVALSMVSTPLLLLLHDRLIAPRYQSARPRPDDKIEAEDQHVIIAGFGRFGQIVGRLLHASRVPLTVLDHDPDQIDLLRRFGFKVFYGDATRIDLMHAAGAAHARALVVAIDDVDESLQLVEAVRREFPKLPVLARARNVSHYYRLRDHGVTVIERETFEASLRMGRSVLEQLGFGAYRARQAALKFRRHNIQSLLAVYPYYKDQKRLMSMTKQAREELEQMFARDADVMTAEKTNGWD